jgi:hypothetical protein
MKDWILVIDALPPQEEWVITYCPDDENPIWLGRWRRNPVLRRVEWQDEEGYDIDPPTHWCPLPAPPTVA